MTFSSSLRFLAFVTSCAAALAATPASSPPHGHGDPILLEQFVTSAAPFGRNQIDLAQATTVLSGRNLLLKQQPTLGETLSGEPGVSATSFGPGASRPIIRGLGGDRIRLLENSVGTLDASVVSPDHAVSIEPFLVERIEVVRGPASLLYGSSAVGGAVNVITHRIEDELPAAPVRALAEVRHASASQEWSHGGLLDIALRRSAERAVVLHLDGFRRSADDTRIPGYAESDRLRRTETVTARLHGEPAPGFARDRLPNSALRSDGGAAGLSFVAKSFHVGANYSGLNTNYGVPGHEHGEGGGTRIALRQRRGDLQAEWQGERGLLTGARLKMGHARYRHAEIESNGDVGTIFSNRGYDARAELLHGSGLPGWSGAAGAQSTRSDFHAAGEEAFLPASRTRSEAVFAFEEIVRGRLTWQFGGRLEQTRMAPASGARRRDREPGGSLGAIWKINEADSVAISLAHTGRAPNAQERFANGPHAGTRAFEIGDPNLRPERSRGAEVSFRRREGFVTGALTFFANRFDGYIFEEPTGLVAAENGDGWELVAAGAGEPDNALPVYRFVQREATFHGAELETRWHLHESSGRQFDLKFGGDLTRGRQSGGRLPRIPAARVLAGIAWTAGPWNLGFDSQFVFSQRRTAAAEEPSSGYTLVSADATYAFDLENVHAQLFARASNLTDAEARPHTSFVRDLAPLAGRSITVGLRIRF